MNPADNVEQTIEKLHISTKAETDKRVLDDAFAAMEKSTITQSSEASRYVRQKNFRDRIIKLAAVAAIVIAMFALFFGISASKTKAPGGIDAALGKAENISITKFRSDSTEPYEQQWFSTALNIKMSMKKNNEQVHVELWDISKRTRTQTFLSSNMVSTRPLTDQMLAELEESMIQNAGLVSFFDIENAAEPDAPARPVEAGKWQRINAPQILSQNPGMKIYEFLWQLKDTTTGEVVLRKWRIFADAETNLPAKAELYSKSQADEEYRLESYMLFSYPQQDEIQTVVRATFGPEGGRPEYISTPQY
ncbi:MAG: hypothetical protein JW715_10585 [Sedimentisphaerales bacterium]|nr:hypothetical protein [Sedimentisphaerales bacterium]